jgi:hypothetical protein
MLDYFNIQVIIIEVLKKNVMCVHRHRKLAVLISNSKTANHNPEVKIRYLVRHQAANQQ